jgi:PAS domain S-box-containing protein
MASDLERAEALRAYGLVEGGVDPSFTRLAKLVVGTTRASMCALAFGDEPEKLIKAVSGPPEVSPTDILSFDLYRELLRGDRDALGEGKVAGAVVRSQSGISIGAWCARTVMPRTWTHETLEVLSDIARLTETELVLREQRRPDEQAARILESMSDACVFLDRDFRYQYVNRKAGDIFGREPKNLIGKYIWAEFPEGVGQRFDLAYRAAVRTQRPIQIEEYYPPYKRWFENRIYPGPEGLAIFFQDVTDRREAEEERRKEVTVRAHAEQMAHLGFWVWSVAENKLRGSEELYRIYGVEEADFEGTFEWYLSRCHPQDCERVRDTIESAVRDGSQFDNELRIVRPSGEIRYLHSWGTTVAGSSSQGVEMRGACLDMTDLIKTTDGLRRTEEWLAAALESMRIAVFEWNVHTNDVRWTAGSERAFKISAEELGKSFDSYLGHVHAEDKEPLLEALRVSVENGTPLDNEHRIITSHGHEYWMEARATPFGDTTGRVSRLVGTVSDITERHNAAEERRKLEQDLQLAQKMEAVGRLAYAVAHDFNNLLAIIRSSTSLLLANDLGWTERETVDGIHEAANRAAALIKQLLAFSKTQNIERGSVDLDQTIHDGTGTLERLLPEGVRLVLDLAPDLPPVLANRSQLDQVLLNLVVNARDAMPDGGDVLVTTRRGAGFAELEVRDTGVGMDAETRSHVFEPFYTTKDAGSGIGLATVYGIVTASGGMIDVKSEPGKGSRFIVRLPLAGDGEVVHSVRDTKAQS